MKKFSGKTALKISTTGVKQALFKRRNLWRKASILSLLLAVLLLSNAAFAIVPPNPVNTSSDLNNAVTTLNAASNPATVTFESNLVDLGTLSSALPTLKVNTTFWNTTNPVTITNTTLGATTSLTSTALLTIANNYDFNFNGASNLGLTSGANGDAGNASSLSTGSIQLDPGSSLSVNGGSGTDVSTAGNVGGSGGNASLTSGSVSIDSGTATVLGGTGGYGYGTTGQTEGSGGNATVSLASLNLISNSYYGSSLGRPTTFEVYGGAAVTDYSNANGANGGVGGNSVFTVSGAVSMDSSQLYIEGGSGGDSYSAVGGNGGYAVVNFDSTLTLTANTGTYSYLYIGGGEGGYSDGDGTPNIGGNGGNAALTVSGAVSVD